MAQAKNGDKVTVHYTGKLENGAVFDTSLKREPMEFTIGGGELIADFEEAVINMSPGDSKTIKISFANAYGPHRDEMLMVVDRSQFPEDLEPAVGQQLQVTGDDGQPMVFTVSEIGDEAITLDGNHPLAGQALTFKITLVA